MAKIAQDWLLLQLTGDVAAVGVASSLQFFPVLVFGLWGGVLADRFNVKDLVVVAQVMQAVSAAALAVLALTDVIAAWHVFVAAFVVGLSSTLEQPGRAGIIGQLAGPHLGQAISLNSIAFQASGFWGPMVASAVAATAGPWLAFAINAVGCTISSLLLHRLPVVNPEARSLSEVGVRRGLATIGRTTEVGWTVALVAVISVFGLNMPLVYAGMANTVFESGMAGYGWFNSMAAIGAVAGGLLAARRLASPRLRELSVLVVVQGIILLLAAGTPNTTSFAAVVVLLNLNVVLFQLLANTLVQSRAEPSALGRVMSLYILVTFGGMSLGGPLIGALIDALGPRWALATLGSLLIGLAALVALGIGRFTGQRVRVTPRGVTIIEPDIPRHVRLGLPPREPPTPPAN